MFGLSELRKTKVYQEALQEGRQEGRQEGEAQLVLRLLTRRFGTVSPAMQAQVQALSLPDLESLGEALLDFSQPADLQDWFRSQS
nr:DUF4351 domain-containing protein [Petrachloros mirabilis]